MKTPTSELFEAWAKWFPTYEDCPRSFRIRMAVNDNEVDSLPVEPVYKFSISVHWDTDVKINLPASTIGPFSCYTRLEDSAASAHWIESRDRCLELLMGCLIMGGLYSYSENTVQA